MRLLKRVKIKLEQGTLSVVKFCGLPILQYSVVNKVKKYFPPNINVKKKHIGNDKPVVYLKVNRGDHLSLMCIQQWIDIVNQLGYDYYILSDKPELNRKILDKIQFYDLDIKFIKSCKNIFLRKIVRNIAVRY